MSNYRLKPTAAVYGVVLNFAEELQALQQQFQQPPYKQAPQRPVLFIKTPNTYNLDGCTVHCPAGARLFSGVTLGVVFKADASRVKASQAWDYVAGFIIANDFSLLEQNYYRPAIKEKCRDGFLAVANTMVGLDEIADVNNLVIETRINGVTQQLANTSGWVRDITQLIAEISDFLTFHAGDILLTGSPANRVEVKAQDQVHVSIESVGSVTNEIVEETV